MFPGPDGGTCINEAAIVAAGLSYRAIGSAEDCPPCFSRPIAGYALQLNDYMPDNARQELLMPYVVRLAGTADTPEVEARRVAHIVLQTVKRILPIFLRVNELEREALACEQAVGLREASMAATWASKSAPFAAMSACHAASHACKMPEDTYISLTRTIGRACSASGLSLSWKIFRPAVEILDEIICLGKHAEPPDVEAVVSRMDKARHSMKIGGKHAVFS